MNLTIDHYLKTTVLTSCNLDTLQARLLVFNSYCAKSNKYPADFLAKVTLPTFSKDAVDLPDVWSWDEEYVLVGADLTELKIVHRDDLREPNAMEKAYSGIFYPDDRSETTPKDVINLSQIRRRKPPTRRAMRRVLAQSEHY